MALQRVDRAERLLVATRRLVRVLDALTAANARTLEMKISDSGPPHLRIDPHILTQARKELVARKRLIEIRGQTPWYHRALADPALLAARLARLQALHARTTRRDFALRLGQTLEIAIQRGLERSGLEFVGAFLDLDDHDDATLYRKEEPPLRFSGARMPGAKRFDFLAFHPTAGRLGVEAKNVREWLYPRRDEITELIAKALAADALPVLIARRVPYVTVRLLSTCGVMIFQTFGQLYPAADADLAAAVRVKEDLGYHDVRTGNRPAPPLLDFLTRRLRDDAGEHRDRFERHKDLLADFAADRGAGYAAFAARIRRREQGKPEDFDEQDDPYNEAPDPDDLTPDD